MSGISKEIKRRLKSIKNTSKITRAMELVSAVKMRKSVQAVLASRPYAHGAWETLKSIVRREGDFQKGLFAHRESKKSCLVVISGNRGLAGSFNSNIAQAVIDYIRGNSLSAVIPNFDLGSRNKKENKKTFWIPGQARNDEGVRVGHVIITFGTKARDELIARGFTIAEDFPKKDVVQSGADVAVFSSYLFDEYLKGSFDQIVFFYTDYESAIKQTVRRRILLPLERAEDPMLGQINSAVILSPSKSDGSVQSSWFDPLRLSEASKLTMTNREFLFEPSRERVLEFLGRRIIETQIFQAVLESQASEHSARMMAMRNATEAANDMISDLTLEYNKERQRAITQELAEIAASRMALE